MAASNDPDDQRHAAMALGNIAANEGNHPQLVARGAIQTLVALSKSIEVDVREYAGFALANLASNADYLDAIGAKGGIDPLVKLAGSANVHTQARFTETVSAVGYGSISILRLKNEFRNRQGRDNIA